MYSDESHVFAYVCINSKKLLNDCSHMNSYLFKANDLFMSLITVKKNFRTLDIHGSVRRYRLIKTANNISTKNKNVNNFEGIPKIIHELCNNLV